MSILSCMGLIVVGLGLGLGSSVATAEMVAIVSAKNPLTALSNNQAVDIFLGKTNRFPDGSPAAPIDQLEGSAARNEFYLKFANKTPAQIKAHWSKIIFTGRGQPPREVSNSAEVKKLVADNPNVIGYIDSGMVDDTVRVLLTR